MRGRRAAALGVGLAAVAAAGVMLRAPAPPSPAPPAAPSAPLDELAYLEASVSNRAALLAAARARGLAGALDRSRLRTPFSHAPPEGVQLPFRLPAGAG